MTAYTSEFLSGISMNRFMNIFPEIGDPNKLTDYYSSLQIEDSINKYNKKHGDPINVIILKPHNVHESLFFYNDPESNDLDEAVLQKIKYGSEI